MLVVKVYEQFKSLQVLYVNAAEIVSGNRYLNAQLPISSRLVTLCSSDKVPDPLA